VIILARPQTATDQNHFPMKGTVLSYEDPTEPVAADDWDVLQ
jgi:hypothetical protein